MNFLKGIYLVGKTKVNLDIFHYPLLFYTFSELLHTHQTAKYSLF